MSDVPLIRQLMGTDAAAFRALRLAGLLEAPTAFGSSYAAEKDRVLDEFAGTMERNYLAGAFVGEELIGVAGFYQLSGEKVSHRGNIWGVYVVPSYRRQGIARLLLEHVLAHARSVVTQVHLCVVTENEVARRLYQRLGFVSYGIEPRSLLVGERYYHEDLMVWRVE